MTPESPSGSRSPGRPRRATTDERIVEATLGLLAEVGYLGMTLDAVAERAGTTKPTIYRRWKGKEELAVAALSRLQTRDQPAPTGDLRRDLIDHLEDFRRKLLRPNGMAMIGTLLAEERRMPRLLALFRERIVAPRRLLLRTILKQAAERGDLEPDLDLDVAGNMLVGSFYARYLSGEPIGPDWPVRVVDGWLKIMVRPSG